MLHSQTRREVGGGGISIFGKGFLRGEGVSEVQVLKVKGVKGEGGGEKLAGGGGSIALPGRVHNGRPTVGEGRKREGTIKRPGRGKSALGGL